MAGKNWKQYFDFCAIEKNRTNGLCKLCRRNYKDKSGVFSNFLKHLKRQHPLEYNQVFNNEHEYFTEDRNGIEDGHEPIDLTNIKEKENRIILSITKNLIIRCNLPLNLVEKPAFRDFMKECSLKYRPVSTKRLKHDIIPSLKSIVLTRIHEKLNTVDHVTLTVDIWSDRQCRSFIGITCHFIDQNINLQAYLIDFLRLKSLHTSENIQQMTDEVLERFKIKKKVFRIVTDNASSMIKAYKFGLSIDTENVEIDERNQFIIENDLMIEDFEEHFESDNLPMMNMSTTDFDHNEDSSSVRLSCFAHTLQLCIRDGLKNAPYISKVLEKCQILGKCSNQSSKIADVLEELNKHISKMNITRWNSEYMLMKSILSIGKSDLDSIVKLMDNPVTFLNNDFTILEEVVDILEPFYDISIKCQSDTIVTVSIVVPAIVHCITHLLEIRKKLSFCTKLVEQLHISIDKRFSGIIHRLNLINVERNEPFNDPLYFMATILDPSFKFYWLRDLNLPINNENRLKQNIIQLIVDEISQDSSLSSPKASSEAVSVPLTTSKRNKKLFVYNEYDEKSNDTMVSDPVTEIDSYLNDPIRTRFSDYWPTSRLTSLKKLVKRIFSVQASSAPVERVFSHAGLILSSRRTNMSEQLFKDLVFLKVNQSLL
ncbi:unnamed protein product [Rotaria socialis]|uniref:BED-type domain-containing protein n=3 Tax=Rotaria TaxID=231623 RepID=A0A820W6L6_9BILA|nr:unnamed protein product [Rotaria socialis]CAF4510134.1 unnamed protein product [Rotaria socialis]